jgi:hypothetical protein
MPAACIVMVKAPRAGAVKTRLVPPLTFEEASSLAACFARDTLSLARRAAGEVFVAYAPEGGRAPLEALLGDGAPRWVEQRGEDLGARIESAAREVFGRVRGPVIVLGTDSPTLPLEFVESAVASLSSGESDLALGPTDDGGYYLVGLRRPFGGLFEGVAWSTSAVYARTAANAARAGLRVLRLPQWFDVDTPEDLARLREEILSGGSSGARATRGWLLAHAASLRGRL